MSNLNETSAGILSLLSGMTLAHAIYHTYQFDRFRCLIPRRKEWFRVLLTYMLMGSNVAMFVWSVGWSVVKYDLGWVVLPSYGAVPVPPQLFPPKYHKWNTPLSIAMNIGYSLQAALNAEEGLYWFHLMRAVQQPKCARSWLSSNFFYAWIVISVITTATQCSIGWIGYDGDENLQISRELLCGGLIEMIVVISASIVVLRFPSFLEDVKTSGAGPDVRSRLHFYHQANKVRTFLRFVFSVGVVMLGADGLRESPRINVNARASDPIIQATVSSFFLVLMISMILYLPRSSPVSPRHRVMVGRQRPELQLASGHALMSLLREGGQWDDDDDLRMAAGTPFEQHTMHSLCVHKHVEDRLPSALSNFTSPIAIVVSDPPSRGPLRIHVEREIHRE